MWKLPAPVVLLAVLALLGGCPSQTDQRRDDETPGDDAAMDARALGYRVSLSEDAPQQLVVEMAFVGDASRETTIVAPERIVEPDDDERYAFETASDDVRVTGEREEGQYVVEHPAGAEVRLRYRVRAHSSPTQSIEQYGPFIRPDGLYFQGSTLFAYPRAMHPGLERAITIDWRRLPEAWTIVGGHRETERLQKTNTALGVVQQSMFLAGDLDLADRPTEQSRMSVALLGELAAPLSELADEAAAIVRAQQAFWRESDPSPYLIALYGPDECCWSTGATKYRSLAGILAHDEPEPTIHQLVQLVAHKHLHRWIPGEMGTPRPFNAYAWFAEGFTEYYARRFKLATGFYDFETYVAEINELLARYHQSPVREATRTQVNSGFKRNPNLTQLAYQRGELLALNWNAAIREATDGEHSLDDVMRRLVERRRHDDTFYLSDETLAETVHEFAPELDLREAIERHIGRGEPIEITSDALGPCARFVAAKPDAPPRFEPVDRLEQLDECGIAP